MEEKIEKEEVLGFFMVFIKEGFLWKPELYCVATEAL